MGEGVGMLVLEEFEYVQKCGVIIYGEIVGYGSNCDVSYMIVFLKDGSGVVVVMEMVIVEVGIMLE